MSRGPRALDNVTHTVIGLIAGEALARGIPSSRAGLAAEPRRVSFVATAMVGGNLPDLDLLYSYRGSAGDKLDYLLGHRGYTHTVLGCLVLSFVLYLAVAAWARRRSATLSRADHVALAGVALFGTALHLAMDALNSYGVHPFWPFDDRWSYGDSIFIVEPLYWVAAAPLVFVQRSAVARAALVLVLVAADLLCIAGGFVPPIAAGFLITCMACLLAIGWRVRARTASFISVAAFLCVTAGFIVAGQCAARRVEALAEEDFPPERHIDHVLTPMPADPLCWDVLLLQTHGDRYVARHTALALAPGLIPVAECRNVLNDQPTVAPRSAPYLGGSGERWTEFSMSVATLQSLTFTYCNAEALMRFARAPFAIRHGGGWIMGDLRYDRGTQLDFSDLDIAADAATHDCPRRPPWAPPREDLGVK